MGIEDLWHGTMPDSERRGKNLRFLQTLLQLTPRKAPVPLKSQDSVVFVSIDFEFGSFHKSHPTKIYEIGISIFDSRDLCGPPSDSRGFIHSQNHNWHRNKRNFLFSISKRTFPSEMRKLLEENIFLNDADGEPRRKVLVGHGLYSELELMRGMEYIF